LRNGAAGRSRRLRRLLMAGGALLLVLSGIAGLAAVAASKTHVLNEQQVSERMVDLTVWSPALRGRTTVRLLELVAEGRGRVDVHPVVFDASGRGRQADLGGGHFDYPPEAFDQGALGGVCVPCLSRDQQLLFHTGYQPRPIDLLDLALLERLTSRS
jgi:hypothetical protein